jgi:hypothetical protein
VVVVNAQAEARAIGHNYIGTEHLLLGLLALDEGPIVGVFGSFEITLEQARELTLKIVGPGDGRPEGQVPFTPRAKKVLELSLREALSLGHRSVRPEHLLLGLIREGEGVACRILLDLGADPRTIRSRLLPLVSEPDRDDPRRTLRRPRSRLSHGPEPEGPPESGAPAFTCTASDAAERLLMSAAARAMTQGRLEYTVDDVRLALAEQPSAAPGSAEHGEADEPPEAVG